MMSFKGFIKQSFMDKNMYSYLDVLKNAILQLNNLEIQLI